MQAYASETAEAAFAASSTRFDGLVAWLTGDQAAGMTHGELEERLHTEGLALLRQLLQDSLDLRAVREQRMVEVIDADGYRRGVAEDGHERGLATRFGQVTVTRIAYRARGQSNLHPADAALNLPVEKHSHGLRKLAAIEAARGSFADTATAIERATGVRLGRRQVEQLAARAAADVDCFYTRHAPDPAPDDVLALSFDGKGVVMRPDGLREATAKAAASQKLSTRLSKGEKRNRKRMCEVAAVYDLTPVPRTIADILPYDQGQQPSPAPRTAGKWLHASVTDDAATVIAAGFAEADRRDPDHQRTWVALVDGNAHQIDRIHAEARTRNLTVPSWSTSSTSLNTSGKRPGASIPRATRTPSNGSAPKPAKSWPAEPASSPPRSAARPPTTAWTPAGAATPTPPRRTCWPRSPTWTTPPPSPKAGRSPPGSSKAPAATWSRTAWTSPAPAGACPAP